MLQEGQLPVASQRRATSYQASLFPSVSLTFCEPRLDPISHQHLTFNFNSRCALQFKMVYTIVVHLYAKAGEDNISKLSAKLIEASRVYSKDKETISWFVMQDTKDPRAFTIVERYEQESVSLATR